MATKQSKIFLDSEGDNYYERNKGLLFNEDDLIFKEIIKLNNKKKINNLLEIGCGDGFRLNLIYDKLKINCFGIDPSRKAIKSSYNSKIKVSRGTADKLNFSSKKFDVVIFGFCLYLVDIEDLIKVVYETDRVLKKNSYIIIYDFYSKKSKILPYKHNNKIKVHKNDFSNIFLWSPKFKLIKKKIFEMNKNQKKQKTKNNWIPVSISIIKKI
jgi:ubiquinone/menaquinone biosynthesis C-methylase UbiE